MTLALEKFVLGDSDMTLSSDIGLIPDWAVFVVSQDDPLLICSKIKLYQYKQNTKKLSKVVTPSR